MEICDNSSCQTWLHHECLIDDILTRTYNSNLKPSVEGTNGAPVKSNGNKKKIPIWQGKFSARINAGSDGGHTEVTIIDMREPGVRPSWKERVRCLKCEQYLE
jgi:hypothetical protein